MKKGAQSPLRKIWVWIQLFKALQNTSRVGWGEINCIKEEFHRKGPILAPISSSALKPKGEDLSLRSCLLFPSIPLVIPPSHPSRFHSLSNFSSTCLTPLFFLVSIIFFPSLFVYSSCFFQGLLCTTCCRVLSSMLFVKLENVLPIILETKNGGGGFVSGRFWKPPKNAKKTPGDHSELELKGSE